MSESTVLDFTGTKSWRTNTRNISATDVQEQYTQIAEPFTSTFEVVASSIITTTSASHIIFIMGDGTLYTRLKRIFVEQVVGATSATLAQLQIVRLTTAGSGGGAITARGRDAADTYAGTIQTLPSSKGTEGVTLLQKRLQLQTTAQVAATTTNPNSWEWIARESENQKPIIVGPSATDGVCLKLVTGIATSTLDISLTFTTDTTL